METYFHDDRAEHVGSCPSDETLAVWLEAKLSPAQAEAVEAHVAGCDRCAGLVAAVAPILELDSTGAVAWSAGEEPSGRAAFHPAPAEPHNEQRAARWRPLLAAAATIVVLLSSALVFRQTRGSEPSRDVATLASLQGDRRQTQGRLHGFPWAEAPPTYRSGIPVVDTPSPDLLTAAADVERKYRDSDAPDELHALGVALLVAGEVDAGLEKLTAAAAARPSDARLLNDAAVAYLQKVWLRHDPAALAEAGRLAESATLLQPNDGAAWFNLFRVAQLQYDAELEEKAADNLARIESSSSGWRGEASALAAPRQLR